MKPRSSWVTVHLVIAFFWAVPAFALMIKLSMLVNEEKGLALSRGADLKARTDMTFQVHRLRSQLDVEASAPALDEAIRTLGMPLQPPVHVADQGFGPPRSRFND